MLASVDDPAGAGARRAGLDAARADSDALLGNTLRSLAADGHLGHLLDYQAHRGQPEHRDTGAAWVARHGLDVSPEQVILTSGGQHAMAVLLGSLAGPGDTLLCEALTYPSVKALADFFRFDLVGVALDERGMIPEAFDEACQTYRPKALFSMPSLHNPTGAHMLEDRRRTAAAIARRHRVRTVEDDIYGFLVEDGHAPLVSHAPELGFYFLSLSKAMAPGLRVSYVAVPRDQVAAVTAAVHATAYMTAPLMAEIAMRWIGDGTGARMVESYRREAIARQALTREALRGFTYTAHPAGFHGILTLPEPWTPGTFVAELRQRGVVLSPASAFAADGTAPPFVRLCLSCTRDRAELARALRIVADLASEPPQAHLAVV